MSVNCHFKPTQFYILKSSSSCVLSVKGKHPKRAAEMQIVPWPISAFSGGSVSGRTAHNRQEPMSLEVGESAEKVY